jgi:lysophospholipase L1-like esterase
MKKLLFVSSYSIYLILVLGLFFHTSAHPELFNKYTVKYFLMLVGLLIFFPFFLWLMWFTLKDSKVRFRKKFYRVKPYQKFLILLIILSLVFILPLEVFLRDKYKNFETKNYYYTIHNFHPFLQFQMTPESEAAINSHGFRGEEIAIKKPENTYRIFVLGGSTVHNGHLPYEDTPTKVLEKLLQKEYPNKKIEVLNAGVDGYTSEHSLIQYLFKIKDFQPDVVIMWHGINDLYYSCSPSDRAYGNYQSDYSHFLSAGGTMVLRYFSPQPILSVHLLSYDFITKAIQDNLFTDITYINNKVPQDPDIYTRVTDDQEYTMQHPSIASYERNVSSLIAAVKADNVSLLLGNQGNLYVDNPSQEVLRKIWMPAKLCSQNKKIPSLASFKASMDQFNQRMKNIAESNEVPFVDFASVLPQNLSYFEDDVHYTKKGSELVAKSLFEKIVSLQLIDPL